MIVNAIKSKVRDALFGDTVDVGIDYFAIGSGTNAVTGAETQLQTEVLRVPLSSITKNGTVDLDAIADILDTDGAQTIREIGFFANATSTPNSGTLVTRVLYTKDKTSLESIQFNYSLGVRG